MVPAALSISSQRASSCCAMACMHIIKTSPPATPSSFTENYLMLPNGMQNQGQKMNPTSSAIGSRELLASCCPSCAGTGLELSLSNAQHFVGAPRELLPATEPCRNMAGSWIEQCSASAPESCFLLISGPENTASTLPGRPRPLDGSCKSRCVWTLGRQVFSGLCSFSTAEQQ